MNLKQEIEEAIDLCIEALNNRQMGEQEVEGNDTRVLEVIHKVAKLPYQGSGLGIGDFGYEGYRSTWEAMYKRFEGSKRITYSLSWKSALLLMYDSAAYNENEIVKSAQGIINDDIIFNHIIKHVVTNSVIKDEVDEALRFITKFKKTTIFNKEEDNWDDGYLIILQHYALKGDPENFFKYFKLSKPAKNRYEVADAKSILVKRFAYNHEIEEALELCRHKNLGEKYYFGVLMAYAEQGKYQDLRTIFERNPELKQPEQETEIQILTTAYLNAIRNGVPMDDHFELLFGKATTVDRKIKRGDCKLQDSLFLDLGLASLNDTERVTRCRKAIKNNSLKRELEIKPKNKVR